jgi:hypothetical protein
MDNPLQPFLSVCLMKYSFLVRIFGLVRNFFVIKDSPVFKDHTMRIGTSDNVLKETFSDKLSGNDG